MRFVPTVACALVIGCTSPTTAKPDRPASDVPTAPSTDPTSPGTASTDTGTATPTGTSSGDRCTGAFRADHDTDGNVDELGTDTYDPADPARLLVRERTDPEDGAVTSTETLSYDDAGRPLTDEYDDRSGFQWRTEWTYDSAGNVLTYAEVEREGTRLLTFTYDADGHELTYQDDTDGDGVAEATGSSVYDGGGRLVQRQDDQDGDGTTDVWSTWVAYDGADRQLEVDVGTTDGGADLTVYRWTYTDAVLAVGTEAVDYDGDGTTDFRWTFEEDAAGRVLSESTDADGDGSVDQSVATTWDPVLGLPLDQTEQAFDGDDVTFLQTQTWTRDAFGRATRYVRKTRGSGTESYSEISTETTAFTACP